jgi:hypothetical protein
VTGVVETLPNSGETGAVRHVEVSDEGLRLSGGVFHRERVIGWREISQIVISEEAGTAQTQLSNTPGAVRITTVSAVLASGEVVLLTDSFAQHAGPDLDLRRWAADLKRRHRRAMQPPR